MNTEDIRTIVRETLEQFFDSAIPVGISNRHIHLCQADYDELFPRVEITKKGDLKQPGEFASNQLVTISGPKGSIPKVRLLGPLRKFSQVEVSLTDARTLGVKPPVVLSGHLEQAVPITIKSEFGQITRDICIVAKRHIHMSPLDAVRFGVSDGESVSVEINTDARRTVFDDVVIRAIPGYVLEMHIDTDEANAANVQGNTVARLLK